MTSYDPTSLSAHAERACRIASRHFLRHRYPMWHLLISFLFVLFVLATAVTIFIGLFIWPGWGVVICAAFTGACAFILGLVRHVMHEQANVFANNAISEGNFTESDICAYYEACYSQPSHPL